MEKMVKWVCGQKVVGVGAWCKMQPFLFLPPRTWWHLGLLTFEELSVGWMRHWWGPLNRWAQRELSSSKPPEIRQLSVSVMVTTTAETLKSMWKSLWVATFPEDHQRKKTGRDRIRNTVSTLLTMLPYYPRHVAVLTETIKKGIHDADSEARSIARKWVGFLSGESKLFTTSCYN